MKELLLKTKNIIFLVMAILSTISIFNENCLYYQNKLGNMPLFTSNELLFKIIYLSILIFGLLICYKKTKVKNNKCAIFLSFLFTGFILIGNSYIRFNTITKLFDPLWLLIIKAIGLYTTFRIIISFLYDKIPKALTKDLKNNRVINHFNKRPFLISLFSIIFCWSIYYIAFYPAVLSPDPANQIKQALGIRTKYSDYSVLLNENTTITNHHPVFHTLLLGGFVRIGKALGNDCFGLFLYTAIQGLLLASTLAYTIKYLKSKNVANKYLILILAIYCLVPHFPFYAINTNKDVYYTIIIILLSINLFNLTEKDKIHFKDQLVLYLDCTFLCLFRNNGIYILFFLLVFILLIDRSKRIRIGSTILAATLTMTLYSNVLLPNMGITGTSKRESMSIFFQSTSRYVLKHQKQLSDNEINIINNVIDYNSITNYKPELADPVKNTYNKYVTRYELKEYFKLWVKHLFKDPVVYLDAFLNNTYGYFDIEKTNWYLYYKFDSLITEDNLVNYHYNKYDSLREVLYTSGVVYPYLPIIGLLSNISFNIYIILAYFIYLINHNDFKHIYSLVPVLVSILVCFASPANAYFRYALPYVFTTPLIGGFWITNNKKSIVK